MHWPSISIGINSNGLVAIGLVAIAIEPIGLVGFGNAVVAQNPQSTPATPQASQPPFHSGIIPAEDSSAMAIAYRQAAASFLKQVAEVTRIIVDYDLSEVNDQKEKYTQWWSATKLARQRSFEYRSAAGKLYQSDPSKYKEIGEMLYSILRIEIEHDRFEGLTEIAECLANGGYVDKDLYYWWGYAALALHQYDRTAELWTKGKGSGQLEKFSDANLEEILMQSKKWQVELERQARDQQKGDLPQVKLTTSKGEIVIELFEDDAPETVNSFIYLAENGYYDGKSFFRVLKNFCAQTGCDRNDGTGSPGYTIRGEMKLPNARNHFRGSISVALGTNSETNIVEPNSGGSQFFFCLMHTPRLDEKYCVFGRVIEGLENLGAFNQVDLSTPEGKSKPNADPDKIVRAEVIRKRPHAYRPTPVTGRL